MSQGSSSDAPSVQDSSSSGQQSQPQQEQQQQPQLQQSQPKSEHTIPSEHQGKPYHEGFLCDGCKGEIYGIRYRCLVCDNYDLCETCEKKGVHSETDHDFKIIDKPVDITQPDPTPLTEEEKKRMLEK